MVLLAPGPLTRAQWPQWGGPGRDFIAPPAAAALAWPAPAPALAWRIDLGPGYSGIAVDGGRVITMLRRGDDEVIRAFADKDGRLLWEHAYRAPAPSSEQLDTSWGSGPNGTPLMVSGRVVTLGFTGVLTCLDAATGKPAWSHDLRAALGFELPYFGLATSPVLHEESVIVLAGGAAAFDLASGQQRWRNAEFRESYASPILVRRGDRTILVAAGEGEVVGLDAGSGALLWRQPHANQFRTILSTPVAGEDGVLFVSAHAKGSIGLALSADGSTVEKRWETPQVQLSHGNAIRVGPLVYTFHNSILVAIDVTRGEIVFRQRGLKSGNLLGVGGRLLLLDEGGGLALLAPSPTGVEVLGQAQVFEGRSWTAPALAGSRLYVRDLDVLQAIDLDRSGDLTALLPSRKAPPRPAPPPELAAAFMKARKDLTGAYHRGDREGLAQAEARFSGWGSEPSVAPLAWYYAGFAAWQQALVAPRGEAVKHVDAAIAHLDKALEIDRGLADAHVILVRLYPMYWQFDRGRAGIIAMKGDEHLDAALRLDPENPRVMAVEGMDLALSPVEYGGDPERGLARLESAVARFEKAPAEGSGLQPDWGHALALVWYAQVLQRLSPPRVEDARQAAERALAIAPELASARTLLEGLQK
jgi:outer membrane protein assembly factor BamB